MSIGINLKKITEECGKLMWYADGLIPDERYKNCESDLLQALRKLCIAELSKEMGMICITGLQGTGKTTLVKNFYELDDTFFNIALGRGERLPILISEKDISEVELYKHLLMKADDSYFIEKKRIDVEEFIVSSGDDKAGTRVMFFEMEVPRKHNCGALKYSFLLLPGYERKQDYWSELIDFSVNSSDTAIAVISPDRIAQKRNEDLLSDISNKFGSNIVYVLTHSDEESEEDVEQYKARLCNIMEISENEKDRVICSGSYTDTSKNEKWIEQMKKSIEKYSASPESLDVRSRKYIETVINGELYLAINEIKELIDEEDIYAAYGDDKRINEYMKPFLEEENKMRKIYRDKVNSFLEIEKNKCKDRLRFESIGENDDDKAKDKVLKRVRKIAHSARISFVGVNLNDLEDNINLIERSLKDENCRLGYEESIYSAISDFAKTIGPKDEQGNQTGCITGTELRNIVVREDVYNDINLILNKDEWNRDKKLQTEDTKLLMKGIVDYSNQYLACYLLNLEYANSEISVSPNVEKNFSRTLTQESVQKPNKLGIAILGATGVDLLTDGSLDFLSKAATTLGVTEPQLLAGFSVIFAAKWVKDTIKKSNLYQLSNYNSNCEVIDEVIDSVKQSVFDNYDQLMCLVRERVIDYIDMAINDGDRISKTINAGICIKNIKNYVSDCRKELKEEKYDIGDLLSGM